MASSDIAPVMIIVVVIASIVYHYRSELKLLRNILPLKSLTGKLGEGTDEQKYDADSKFECPRCGGKMEKVTLRDSSFLLRNQVSSLGSSLFDGDISSSPIGRMNLFGLPAYRCKLCGLICFDEFGSMLP